MKKIKINSSLIQVLPSAPLLLIPRTLEDTLQLLGKPYPDVQKLPRNAGLVFSYFRYQIHGKT